MSNLISRTGRVESWIEDPTSLPWSGYLLSGGDPLAFPYGFVMFIWHLPTTAVGWLMDYFFTTKTFISPLTSNCNFID